jgi:hypothetical protein
MRPLLLTLSPRAQAQTDLPKRRGCSRRNLYSTRPRTYEIGLDNDAFEHGGSIPRESTPNIQQTEAGSRFVVDRGSVVEKRPGNPISQ